MIGRLTFLALMGVLVAGGPAVGGGFDSGRPTYDRYCANCVLWEIEASFYVTVRRTGSQGIALKQWSIGMESAPSALGASILALVD